MTTPNNQPTPPPGMRLLTQEELEQPLTAKPFSYCTRYPKNGWIESTYSIGETIEETEDFKAATFWAIPIIPATGDKEAPPGYRRPTEDELENGIIPKGTLKQALDGTWEESKIVGLKFDNIFVYAVPIAGDTTNEKGGDQRPIPKPLFPCKHCYEDRTWPAEDLYWSEIENGWVCIECWDDETHGEEPGATLQEEIDTPTAPVEQRQELLPCPFCKTSDIWSGWNGSSAPGTEDCGYWSTGCAACGIEFHADEQEEAEKLWNTRK